MKESKKEKEKNNPKLQLKKRTVMHLGRASKDDPKENLDYER